MAAIIVLRDKASGSLAPAVPDAWSSNYEDGGWSTVYTPTGQVMHAWLAVDGASVGQPTRGVWIVVSRVPSVATRLRAIADASVNAWTLAELRADGGGTATAIKAAWRDQRPRDEEGDPVDDGRPLASLRSTIAGHSFHSQINEGGPEDLEAPAGP